jgi:hypothetical protein
MALLALIAATVSYLHMHMLVELHGQPGWVNTRDLRRYGCDLGVPEVRGGVAGGFDQE